jgi:hypothetical protein
MSGLTAPTPERAEHILREVGVDEEFVGLKMSAMGGSSPSKLHSLVATARFLDAGTYEEAIRPASKATIGYVDLNLLVKWVTDVFGDTELAAAIQVEIDTGKAFGYVARPIKALLLERVEQCESVLAQVSATA